MEHTKFTYNGPVKEFDKVIATNWSGSTYAPSEKKARSNLAYQFKREFGKDKNVKITLPGRITRID